MMKQPRKPRGVFRSPDKTSAPVWVQAISAFAEKYRMTGKGALSLALALTRHAMRRAMPLNPDDFLTKQGGQVAGMGKAVVQSILRDYGIKRVLAEEAGRTSRGSIARMRAYLEFLNDLNREGILNLAEIQKWWINRVQEYFASQPIRLKLDPSKSLRNAVHDLLDSAFIRQRKAPGMMVAGALMQHLAGAKLELMLTNLPIEHRGFSVADSPGGKKGDFLIHDAAIHITTAPTEALIRKCLENLEQGFRPVIITTESGLGGAKALAQNAGLAERIDILEIEQFVATNIYEKSGFAEAKRAITAKELIQRYNDIIDKSETDPSLRIVLGL